ncbi:hypothetical protein PC9H_008688 [Pleurotus ostreatus]|uniref:Uncharacterized protein n=2 Tax=Pleurotus TaxID=5320 RepID=A0A8H6ZP94_PLEOS|nr:uncharacterized protein PC9H_008688 [Pleurotus ostreatus]KAF7426320.1 hypothetical protein PC9H_008688 [Pleurotus ostreatus]KAG9221930.1 hypothetical protein CCMSSC00406_0005755 [Pleurotus cornucopiae]KAJ8693828.1 hypothetical protein PTI98_008785 [Pleurotus ostreatus]
MVYSTYTVALAGFLLQAMTVMSTPLQLSPRPVESATPDSIGSFGAGWSTSPMRGPLPIQQPSSRPPFRIGTTQLGPLFPKYTYQGMDSDLHARSDIASDVADLAKLLNSRDVEMLDARGFGDILGKIFGKLGPLLLQRREVDDEAMAQLEHPLQSRELANELEARGLFGFIPKLFNMISKGRNAADTILSPATPPSLPTPTASNAPAPQKRSDDPDTQALNRLFSRYLAEDERQGIHGMLDSLVHFPMNTNGHSLVNSRPLVEGLQLTPSSAPQRRAMEDDFKELERLLGREMTDVERRGLGTKLGQAAPFAPLLFQGFDWIKDHIGNHDSPAQPVESAAPQ